MIHRYFWTRVQFPPPPPNFEMDNSKIIRSSLEIALEKIKNINISDEEIKKAEYFEIGKKIAGQYLTEKKFNLLKAIDSYPETVRKYIKESIENILLMNIVLPRKDSIKKENRKAMEGIVILKKDKNTALQICSAIEEQLNNYKRQVDETYKQLKKNFQSYLEDTRKEMEQQIGLKVKINIESIPEFQKQWKEILSQIDSEYTNFLELSKQELKNIS